VRLTVLGSCGAWPEPGRACSGFLLEHDGFRVVLDLGFGVASRLFTHCPDGDVDAVVITHEHPDHCVDLNALFRARYYADRTGLIPLYCTPGVVRRLSAVEPSPPLTEVFEIFDLPGDYDVGPLRLSGIPLPHHVPNAGVRLSAPGVAVAYTGDTGPDPALARLGRNAALFIVDATLTTEQTGPRTLMTAREAGLWAAQAGAERLMLTHFWPGTDRAAAIAAAREEFDGEILAAEEDLTVRLS
jgi:ribonuclease BN (tRNA processing enzyme)